MATHVPSQPTNVALPGGVNKAFLSALQILDRTYTPELISKYGAENYTFILDLLNKKRKVDNQEFYHREQRRVNSNVQVASISPASPTAGVDVTVTIASASHWDSGTKSGVAIGDVLQVSASGVLGKVLSVGRGTANAHTAVVQPLKSTDIFAPAANDFLLIHGRIHVGEASDKGESVVPIFDKITNYVTDIRADMQFTDYSLMEKVEIAGGYKRKGTEILEKKWLHTREMVAMFSTQVTNTAITANGTKGTIGLVEQVKAGGNDLGYTAGSMAIADFDAVERALTFNGADPEIHVLQDIYQNQEINKMLFNLFPNGAVSWGSVGGSAEIAAKYGFNSLTKGGFTYHFKKYAGFSPEWAYGVAPVATPAYRHYSLFLPQGLANGNNGNKIPTVGLVYQELPEGGEMAAWETGGLADSNKTPKRELWQHMQASMGVESAASNQCVIFQA